MDDITIPSEKPSRGSTLLPQQYIAHTDHFIWGLKQGTRTKARSHYDKVKCISKEGSLIPAKFCLVLVFFFLLMKIFFRNANQNSIAGKITTHLDSEMLLYVRKNSKGWSFESKHNIPVAQHDSLSRHNITTTEKHFP